MTDTADIMVAETTEAADVSSTDDFLAGLGEDIEA